MSKQTSHIYHTHRGWIIRTEFRLSGFAACVGGRCFPGDTRAKAVKRAKEYVESELTTERPPTHAA